MSWWSYILVGIAALAVIIVVSVGILLLLSWALDEMFPGLSE